MRLQSAHICAAVEASTYHTKSNIPASWSRSQGHVRAGLTWVVRSFRPRTKQLLCKTLFAKFCLLEEEAVVLANVAERAERYEDMVDYMKAESSSDSMSATASCRQGAG